MKKNLETSGLRCVCMYVCMYVDEEELETSGLRCVQYVCVCMHVCLCVYVYVCMYVCG